MSTTEIDWEHFGLYDRTDLPRDWVHVVQLGDSGGYDWTTFHAFYGPTERRFFWAGDSGCSCNYWGEDLRSPGDFADGSRDDLLRAIRSFAEENRYSVSASAAIDAVDAVRRFRP